MCHACCRPSCDGDRVAAWTARTSHARHLLATGPRCRDGEDDARKMLCAHGGSDNPGGQWSGDSDGRVWRLRGDDEGDLHCCAAPRTIGEPLATSSHALGAGMFGASMHGAGPVFQNRTRQLIRDAPTICRLCSLTSWMCLQLPEESLDSLVREGPLPPDGSCPCCPRHWTVWKVRADSVHSPTMDSSPRLCRAVSCPGHSPGSSLGMPIRTLSIASHRDASGGTGRNQQRRGHRHVLAPPWEI